MIFRFKRTETLTIIDTIGGQQEHAWVGKIAPTLKASHYKFPPCVVLESEKGKERQDNEDVKPV